MVLCFSSPVRQNQSAHPEELVYLMSTLKKKKKEASSKLSKRLVWEYQRNCNLGHANCSKLQASVLRVWGRPYLWAENVKRGEHS